MRNTFLLNPKNHRVSVVLFLLLLFAAVFPLLAIIENGPPSEESPSREKPADDPYGERPADWPSDEPWSPRDDDDEEDDDDEYRMQPSLKAARAEMNNKKAACDVICQKVCFVFDNEKRDKT